MVHDVFVINAEYLVGPHVLSLMDLVTLTFDRLT